MFGFIAYAVIFTLFLGGLAFASKRSDDRVKATSAALDQEMSDVATQLRDTYKKRKGTVPGDIEKDLNKVIQLPVDDRKRKRIVT